jgi:hypothetical protein
MHVFANFEAQRGTNRLEAWRRRKARFLPPVTRGAKLLLPYSGMWAHH